ncbi:MAG: VWA domain-containing protein [Deltaproteobacteria bacterium]|nr:VWA domain-containing protein [Deltaproteobacteria bacterium]
MQKRFFMWCTVILVAAAMGTALTGCSCNFSAENTKGDDDDDDDADDDTGGDDVVDDDAVDDDAGDDDVDDDQDDDDDDDDDLPCPGYIVQQKGPTDICEPAGVRVVYSVTDCDGAPVAGLGAADFQIINDESGEPFEGEGGSTAIMEALEFEFYSILVLDLSYSIVSNGHLDAMLDGAEVFIDKMLVDQPDTYKHSIAIYIFGSTDASELVHDFSKDATSLKAVIDGLRSDPGRGSTNLYGAFVTALNYLNNAGTTELVSRNLVLFSDGTHETGDADEMRSYALSRLENSSATSFSIGVQGDYNEDDLRELASRPEYFFLVTQTDEIEAGFESVAALVRDWSRANYVVGVCSPLEGPNRSLTIRVQQTDGHGELSVGYSAEGFNLVGCEPDLVAQGNACSSYSQPGDSAPRLSDGFWEEDDDKVVFTHLLKWSVCDEDNDLSGGQVFTWLAGTSVPFFGNFEIYFDDFTGGAPNAPDCDNPLEISGIPVDFTGWVGTYCADVEVTDGNGNLSNKLTNICVTVP